MEQFSKSNTELVKGIAVSLMLAHHLFNEEAVTSWGIESVFLRNSALLIDISSACKCCVSIFVFLTGYGMTCKYQRIAPVRYREKIVPVTLLRYWKLLSGFWPAYFLGILIRCLILGQWNIYEHPSGGGGHFRFPSRCGPFGVVFHV